MQKHCLCFFKKYIYRKKMSRKKKIYEDENGRKYILKNGKKEYVVVIDSCVDFFEDTEGLYNYLDNLSDKK